ncbi:MAG: hypothetical protein ACR2H3_02965 [Acidimicrobiales bacterium]
MVDLEFFFDPVCPWAWITSRWAHEVREVRSINIEWRFISLRIINEHRDYDKEFPPGYAAGHGLGLRLLRVAAAIADQHDNAAVERFYSAVGTSFHIDRRFAELVGGIAIEEALTAAEPHTDLAAATDDDGLTAQVRADSELALSRVGRDMGTPVLTFAPPDGPSFFGPVIDRVPEGEEAGRLWDLVRELAAFSGFEELKRSARADPQTDWRRG